MRHGNIPKDSFFMGKIYITDPGKKKKVLAGELNGFIFSKKVKPIHFMYKYNGYGIQSELIEQFLKSGVTNIHILLSDHFLASTPSDWWEKGQIDNAGNGDQIFLNIDLMTKHEMLPK